MEYQIISILLGLCVIYPAIDGKSSIQQKNTASPGLIGESLDLIHKYPNRSWFDCWLV